MLDVYKRCYKLDGEPFRLGPDHRFSFAHPSYANAKAYMEYAISQGEGIIVVTGDAGTGKTTLISEMLAGIDETGVQIAILTGVQLDPENLLKRVLDAFSVEAGGNGKTSLLTQLERFLLQRYKEAKRVILIVDEAQGISAEALEKLRLLSNFQYDNQLLLQIFLVGQKQLMETIQMPGMAQLRQRLIAASHLEPLDYEQTVAYVEHRLRHVGWQGDPAISNDALRQVYQHSGGVPRWINLICHRMFLYGGLKKKHELFESDAVHVIEELIEERVLTIGTGAGRRDEGAGEAEPVAKTGLPVESMDENTDAGMQPLTIPEDGSAQPSRRKVPVTDDFSGSASRHTPGGSRENTKAGVFSGSGGAGPVSRSAKKRTGRLTTVLAFLVLAVVVAITAALLDGSWELAGLDSWPYIETPLVEKPEPEPQAKQEGIQVPAWQPGGGVDGFDQQLVVPGGLERTRRQEAVSSADVDIPAGSGLFTGKEEQQVEETDAPVLISPGGEETPLIANTQAGSRPGLVSDSAALQAAISEELLRLRLEAQQRYKRRLSEVHFE